MLPIAHAADWISLAFAVPVFVFICWLAITQFRERRSGREHGDGTPGES